VHATYHGDAPTVDGTSDSLDLTSQHGNGSRVQNWTIGVPPSQLRTLQVTANAATMTADVGAAHLDQLRGDLNAGDARVQAGEASVKAVDLGMNAGRIRLTLGTGGTTGSLSVNAGSIDLCVPSSAGLRLTVDEQLTFVTNLSSRDLTRQGNLWTRPDGGGGTIELSVSGNAAAFNLDPDGGC
jgi:hypothetical protein